jgi:hypothetical protein
VKRKPFESRYCTFCTVTHENQSGVNFILLERLC